MQKRYTLGYNRSLAFCFSDFIYYVIEFKLIKLEKRRLEYRAIPYYKF